METKVLDQEVRYNIIGSGPMIEGPVVIGDWYCVPMEQYESTIPPEAHQELARFLKSGIPYKGFVVMDDRRRKEIKQKAEVRPPEVDENLKAAVGLLFTVIGAIAMMGVAVALFILNIDPTLCAVDSEDRWLEIYSW